MINTNESTDLLFDQETGVCAIYRFITLAVLCTCFCIVGFISNCLTIITLHRAARKKSVELILLTLACVDCGILVIMFLLMPLPAMVQYVNYQHYLLLWVMPYLFAVAIQLQPILHFIRVYLLVFLAVLRYQEVCHYQAQPQNIRYRVCLVLVSWITFMACLFNAPRFPSIQVTRSSLHPGLVVVHREYTQDFVYKTVYNIVISSLAVYLIPTIILLGLSFKFIASIRSFSQNYTVLTPSQIVKNEGTKMITAMLTFSIGCESFTFAFHNISELSSEVLDQSCSSAHFYITPLSVLLYVANSSFSVYIYCYFSRAFRKVLRHQVSCLLCDCGQPSPDLQLSGYGVSFELLTCAEATTSEVHQ